MSDSELAIPQTSNHNIAVKLEDFLIRDEDDAARLGAQNATSFMTDLGKGIAAYEHLIAMFLSRQSHIKDVWFCFQSSDSSLRNARR